jgi:hypothetical protein
MSGSDDREFWQQVGYCYEILPPHNSRDETVEYGPSPPQLPGPPSAAEIHNWGLCGCRGGSPGCTYAIERAERSR